MRNAPYRRALPWLGVAWIVFPLWIYWSAAVKPIWDNLTSSGAGRLNYLNNSGITGSLVFAGIGLVIWASRSRPRATRGSTPACSSPRSHRTSRGNAWTPPYLHRERKTSMRPRRPGGEFLNPIKLNVYKANIALMAGDFTGKAIVPIVQNGDSFEA